MIIKQITLKNFQLFKSASCDFEKLNCITGQNLDSPNESGNGSGKSTLVLRAILFALYGYVEEGLTLKDLIRFDAKEASVEIVIEKDNSEIRVIRKIPSSLQIYLNGNDVVANTASIKQEFITEHFGDIAFFRQYRCVSDKQGINVLDLGIVSLRKTLMQFIESYFSDIRTRLLTKKSERERYSIEKKIYKHFLSEKRANVLDQGLRWIKEEYAKLQREKDIQQGVINELKSKIMSSERIVANKEKELRDAQSSGTCPILKKKCLELKQPHLDVDIIRGTEVAEVKSDIKDLKSQLENEQDSIDYYDASLQLIRNKEARARECLLRLQYAEREKEYKYTKADIMIYDEAIKTLDAFSGAYIKEWLGSLSIIINNMLQQLNISIEFSSDKDFLKVQDNGQVMKYNQLSDGQKCFLNVVFKLAILLQQNQSGIILFDDGINEIHPKAFPDLINVLKTLPFQAICVYQAYEEIEGVKHVEVERKDGNSQIKS